MLTPTETPPIVMGVLTGAGTGGVGTETVVEPPFEVTVGAARTEGTVGAAGTEGTIGVVTGRLGKLGKETEVGRLGVLTGRLGKLGKETELGSLGRETELGCVGVVTGRLGSVGKETEVGKGSTVLAAWVTPFANAVTVSTMPVTEPLEGRDSEPPPPEPPGTGRPVDVGIETGTPRLERVPFTSLTSPLTTGSTPAAPLPGADPMLPSVHVTPSTRSAPPLAQPLPVALEPPGPTRPALPIPEPSEPQLEIPPAVVPLEPSAKTEKEEMPLVSERSTSASVASAPALDLCPPTPEWEAAALMASAKGVA